MSYVTEAELTEIVPDLRALASVETSAEVRDALIRLANRYAAMALDCRNLQAMYASRTMLCVGVCGEGGKQFCDRGHVFRSARRFFLADGLLAYRGGR
jgi:hypothetical protein